MIRVLIERRVAEGMVEVYQLAVREVRREATQQPGYISGETLRDAADPCRYVIISTWKDEADWERWAGSDARRRLLARIAPLLEEPERVSVLLPV